jgi:hypothetical protein
MAKKHWIYIKRGLSEDPKHRAAMGECIWLFMHIIDRADWETGIAYNWKDEEEAADMGVNPLTLRDQRQKLQRLDYIRCTQKQHAQDIMIMEWVNPRDYSAGVKNRRNELTAPEQDIQGKPEPSPSDFQGKPHGNTQGKTQGGRKSLTPTSYSDSGVSDQTSAPDFENMTVPEAMRLGTLRLYKEATGYFPGSLLWETVHNTITQNSLTHEQLRAAAVAWQARGYKRENVAGILEWATNGIPQNGQKQGGSAAAPAVDEKAVQETQRMLAEKMHGNFVPRPDHIKRPRIGKPS